MNTLQMKKEETQDCVGAEPFDRAHPSFFTQYRWWNIAAACTLIALALIAISAVFRSRSVAKVDRDGPHALAQYSQSAEPATRTDSSVGLISMNSPQQSVEQKAETRVASKALSPSSPPTPLVARTAGLNILVKDIAHSRTSLDSILARHSGYSAVLHVSTPESGPRQFQASLRVPAPELTATIADLRGLGSLLNESQSGEEVTQQHADLIARLQNSRETEQRLRAILQQRTGKIEDVLQVEEEISRVRGEIESMEAEQRTLEHRVTFATVDVQLVEEYTERFNSAATSTSGRIRNAFVQGMRNAAETILGMVLFVEEFGPAFIIWAAILGIPTYLIWRRYGRTRAKA